VGLPWERVKERFATSSAPARSQLIVRSETAEGSSSVLAVRDSCHPVTLQAADPAFRVDRFPQPNAPQLEGTGEIKLEGVDRAGGYWTTRSEGDDAFHARTSGIYFRADPGDIAVLNGNDAAERAALIEQRLEDWKSFTNS
jgi:hypothetical protein